VIHQLGLFNSIKSAVSTGLKKLTGSSGTTATTAQKGAVASTSRNNNNTSVSTTTGPSSPGSGSTNPRSAENPRDKVANELRDAKAKGLTSYTDSSGFKWTLVGGKDGQSYYSETKTANQNSGGGSNNKKTIVGGVVSSINAFAEKPVTLGDGTKKTLNTLKTGLSEVKSGLDTLNNAGRPEKKEGSYGAVGLRFGPTISGRLDGSYKPKNPNDKPATVADPVQTPTGPNYGGPTVSSNDYRDKIMYTPVEDRKGVIFGNSDTVTEFDINALREVNKVTGITNPNFQGKVGMDVGAFNNMFGSAVTKANAPSYESYVSPGSYQSPTGEVRVFVPNAEVPKGWVPLKPSTSYPAAKSGRGSSVINETVEASGHMYADMPNEEQKPVNAVDVFRDILKRNPDTASLNSYINQYNEGKSHGREIGLRTTLTENLNRSNPLTDGNSIFALLNLNPLYKLATAPASEIGANIGALDRVQKPITDRLDRTYQGTDGRLYLMDGTLPAQKDPQKNLFAKIYSSNPVAYNNQPIELDPDYSTKRTVPSLEEIVNSKVSSQINAYKDNPTEQLVKIGTELAISKGAGMGVGLIGRTTAKGAILAGDALGIASKTSPKVAKYLPSVMKYAPTVSGTENLLKRVDFVDDAALVLGAVPYAMGYNTDLWSNVASGNLNPSNWITLEPERKAKFGSQKFWDQMTDYATTQPFLEYAAGSGYKATYRTPDSIRYTDAPSITRVVDGKKEVIPSGTKIQKAEYVPEGKTPDIYVYDRDAYNKWNRAGVEQVAFPKSFRETVSNPPTPSQKNEIVDRALKAKDIADFMERRNNAIYDTSDITIYSNMIRGDLHSIFSPVSRGVERVAPGKVSEKLTGAVDKIKPKPQYLDNFANIGPYKDYAASLPAPEKSTVIKPHPDDIIVDIKNGSVGKQPASRSRTDSIPTVRKNAAVQSKPKTPAKVQRNVTVNPRAVTKVDRPVSKISSVPAKVEMPAKLEIQTKLEIPTRPNIPTRPEIQTRPEIPIKPDVRITRGNWPPANQETSSKRKKQRKSKFKNVRDVYNVRDPFENRKMI
jgi:hypothetical protein